MPKPSLVLVYFGIYIYIYIYIYVYNNVLRIAVFLVRAFNLVLQVFLRLCGTVLGEMFYMCFIA